VMSSSTFLCVSILFFGGLVIQSEGSALWGVQGHQLVALIAQGFLNDNALQQVQYLLPSELGQLSLVSSWADQVRTQAQWKFSAPLHYVNTPPWVCDYIPSRDCGNQMCIVTAILNYTNILNQSSSYETQVSALKFVVHFMGDLVQPLHLGFTTDRGGNDISGTFFTSATNLHSLWDSGIVSRRISTDFAGKIDAYTSYLMSQIATQWQSQQKEWLHCDNGHFPCPAQWANETVPVACQSCYTDTKGNAILNGFQLADPYFQANKLVVDNQLAKGGVRLAAILNQIWS